MNELGFERLSCAERKPILGFTAAEYHVLQTGDVCSRSRLF